ncbi:MAG: hypothetical protein COA99_05480 [Moraxellaceae bacterium]|nr:MAG: hypothetical protein COA99_05480 [Moraxellaceae bacterium]
METQFNKRDLKNIERCLYVIRHLEKSTLDESVIRFLLHKIHKMNLEIVAGARGRKLQEKPLVAVGHRT